jgi:hypothetical protein
MGIPVKLHIMVRDDDIDAMFKVENKSSSARTRQLDTRYHFIREHFEDGFIKILLVKKKTMIQTSQPRMERRI